MYSLEDHFNNPYYNNLDNKTKQTFIKCIKDLSKLCRNKEWDGYFPEYLVSRIAIEVKLDHWYYDKELYLMARDQFMNTI
jgi:hypothetical protein